MGCKDCVHVYKEISIKCDLKPHDYVTEEQRAIVKWLQSPCSYDPWTADGCPGHVTIEGIKQDRA